MECDGVNWIRLTQDKDQWRILVNVAMNFWVTINAEMLLANFATLRFLRILHCVVSEHFFLRLV
jgi:hypothetical protein